MKINRSTYGSDDQISRRTRAIFSSFARVLHGRSKISEGKRQAEIENLIKLVRNDILYTLFNESFQTQAEFDSWHEMKVSVIKKMCPISWGSESQLTIGMCQKIINLHSKDLWALNLVSEQSSSFFHPIIDQVTLRFIKEANIDTGKIVWTKINSYEEYLQLQFKLRELSKNNGTYPLALECKNWNLNR